MAANMFKTLERIQCTKDIMISPIIGGLEYAKVSMNQSNHRGIQSVFVFFFFGFGGTGFELRASYLLGRYSTK
jgi:hypothetical protein